MAPCNLQPYDSVTFGSSLTQINGLINYFTVIKNSTTPCEPCMCIILHDIATHLDFLRTLGPSKNIADELTDLNHLTKLSRQLLELDASAITSAVWTLVDRKMTSLYDTRLAIPIPTSWNDEHGGARRQEESLALRGGRRANREADFGVVERDVDRQVQEPRAPVSNLDVVERKPSHQQSTSGPPTIKFNVVERSVESLGGIITSVERNSEAGEGPSGLQEVDAVPVDPLLTTVVDREATGS